MTDHEAELDVDLTLINALDRELADDLGTPNPTTTIDENVAGLLSNTKQISHVADTSMSQASFHKGQDSSCNVGEIRQRHQGRLNTEFQDLSQDYNQSIPFYSGRKDKKFVKYLSSIHVNEIETELEDVCHDPLLFDLTKGLERKFYTCEYKPRPLLVPFFYAFLSLPFIITNNYYYSIPSLIISLLLIIICILKTNWKLRSDIRKYLIEQGVQRVESLKNGTYSSTSKLKIHELKHQARESMSMSQTSRNSNKKYTTNKNNTNANTNEVVSGSSSNVNNTTNTDNYQKHRSSIPNNKTHLSGISSTNSNNNFNSSGDINTSGMEFELGRVSTVSQTSVGVANADDISIVDDEHGGNSDYEREPSQSRSKTLTISRAPTVVLNQFTSYDAFCYEDLPSKILDFADIDKGDISNNDEGGVVPREIGWFLFCGGFYMLTILFLTQLYVNIEYHNGNTHGLIDIAIGSNWFGLCSGDDYLDDELVANGICLVRHGTISSIFAFFGYCIFASTFVFQVPTKESQDLIYQVEENIRKRFKKRAKHKMDAIEENCQITTKRFVDFFPISKKWHLSGGVIFWAAVCSVMSLTAIFAGNNEIFFEIDDNKSIFAYGIYFITRPFVAFFLYRLLSESWVINHMFIRDWVAVSSLGGAIYASSIEDIICWYEMRSYYINYKQAIVSGGRGQAPFGFILIFSILSGCYMAYQITFVDGSAFLFNDPNGLELLCIVVMSVLMMLRFVVIAVLTYRAQTLHIGMLKHELIRLITLKNALNVHKGINHNVNCQIICQNEKEYLNIVRKYGNKYGHIYDLVRQITHYLKTYDEAPRILGIPMTQATLITAIGYTITMTITLSGLIG